MRRLPVLLLAACAASGAGYEDPDGKFHFELPGGWTVTKSGELPGETPLGFAKGEFSLAVTVVVRPNEETESLERLATVYEQDLGAARRTRVEVDRLPAERLEVDDGDNVTVLLVLLSGNDIVTVEFSADGTAWSRERETYDTVLAGFHLGPRRRADAEYEADFRIPDDGTTLFPGNPPLTRRLLAGCLAAAESALRIELTLAEQSELARAVRATFHDEDAAAREAVARVSEDGWAAANGAVDAAAREAARGRLAAGSGPFAEAIRVLEGAVRAEEGKVSAHEAAAWAESAAFALSVVFRRRGVLSDTTREELARTAGAIPAGPARADVEWMALRAAYSSASEADRRGYRERLLAALGGTAEAAEGRVADASAESLPALAQALREAAKPLLDTLAAPVDAADPEANAPLRFRY